MNKQRREGHALAPRSRLAGGDIRVSQIPPPGHTFDGARLRAARIGRGLSIHKCVLQLARLGSEVSFETLRSFEKGASEPRVTLFFHLCLVLRKSPAAFFTKAAE
jgi:DNA-binding XRE family transcriptional regulator